MEYLTKKQLLNKYNQLTKGCDTISKVNADKVANLGYCNTLISKMMDYTVRQLTFYDELTESGIYQIEYINQCKEQVMDNYFEFV